MPAGNVKVTRHCRTPLVPPSPASPNIPGPPSYLLLLLVPLHLTPALPWEASERAPARRGALRPSYYGLPACRTVHLWGMLPLATRTLLLCSLLPCARDEREIPLRQDPLFFLVHCHSYCGPNPNLQ